MTDDEVIRVRGLIATAKMEMAKAEERIGDRMEPGAYVPILEAMTRLDEVARWIMAGNDLTFAAMFPLVRSKVARLTLLKALMREAERAESQCGPSGHWPHSVD